MGDRVKCAGFIHLLGSLLLISGLALIILDIITFCTLRPFNKALWATTFGCGIWLGICYVWTAIWVITGASCGCCGNRLCPLVTALIFVILAMLSTVALVICYAVWLVLCVRSDTGYKVNADEDFIKTVDGYRTRSWDCKNSMALGMLSAYMGAYGLAFLSTFFLIIFIAVALCLYRRYSSTSTTTVHYVSKPAPAYGGYTG